MGRSRLVDEDPVNTNPAVRASAEHALMVLSGKLYMVFAALVLLFPISLMQLLLPFTLAGRGRELSESQDLTTPMLLLLVELAYLYLVNAGLSNSYFAMNTMMHRLLFNVCIVVNWLYLHEVAVDVPLLLVPPDIIITTLYLKYRHGDEARRHIPEYRLMMPFAAGSGFSDHLGITLPGLLGLAVGILGSTGLLVTVETLLGPAYDEHAQRFAWMVHLAFGLLAVLSYHSVTKSGSTTWRTTLFANVIIRPFLFSAAWLFYGVHWRLVLLFCGPSLLGGLIEINTQSSRLLDDFGHALFR